MPEDRRVQVNGLSLHYRNFGAGDKPAILFMHGLMGNCYAFDHVAPKFASTHRVLTMDFRGHGDSDWNSDGDYALRRHVSDVFGVLAATEIRRVTLIGSSLGGAVATVIAARKPDLVERVVLNDVGPEIDAAGLREAEKRPSLVEQDFRDIGEALAYYKRSYPPVETLPDAVATELVRNSTRVADNGRLRWKTDPRVQVATRPSDESAPAADLWPLFEAVKAPILVVRGAESDILLPATVAKMCSCHPGTKAVEVPRVGHTPWLSEPEALAALRAFLLV